MAECLVIGRKFVGFVELVSPCAIAAFDRSVELGRSGRQDVAGEALVLGGLLELGHELGAAVDLNGLDGKQLIGGDLVEEAGGGLGGDAFRRPFGDRIVGGEVSDRLGLGQVDVDGVDLGAVRLDGLSRSRLLPDGPSAYNAVVAGPLLELLTGTGYLNRDDVIERPALARSDHHWRYFAVALVAR